MTATVHKTLAEDAMPIQHKLDPAGQVIVLNAKHAAHVNNAAGWTVRAIDGSVWITQDGDIRDIVIESGQSFVLDRHAPALLWAFDRARISLRLEHASPQTRRQTAPMRQTAPQWSIA